MFMKKLHKNSFFKAEDGAVMVVAVVCLIAFLSLTSLVTDMGLKYYQKSRLQSAMDSAALAAAKYMPDEGKAKTVALEYVEKNGFSTESVVIEFPGDDIVRVSDKIEAKTIFASLFKVNSVQIYAKAAAKYIDRNVSVDVDYLMFHGDCIPFTLGGHYNIGGSIFGNGNVHADGGAGSKITGTVFSSQAASCNPNSVSVGGVKSHVGYQKMPEYDEMIMTVVPVVNESMFEKTYTPISATARYINRYSSDTNIESVLSLNGSTYCNGNLTTGWNSELMTIYGDLYVTGNFEPQCPVYVTGNVYCGGNLTTAWDKTFKVGGNLYVAGNTSFQGTATVYGNYFYTGGNLTRGSTYSLTCECETYIGGNATLSGLSDFKGAVYCRGNFQKQGSATMKVSGNVYAYRKLDIQSGGAYINGDIYVYGKELTSADAVTTICGPMTLKGDIYNRTGKLELSGQGTYLIKGVVYSGGSIYTNQGSNGITLSGCVIAEEDICIGGSTHTYNEEGGTLSIYSRNGNVVLYSQQGGFDVWGMIYAPNGDVNLASGDFDIHGSIIGNTITCMPGGLSMSYNDRALPFGSTVKTSVLVE